MNEICYDKVIQMVTQGHQVMVFVHARNATHQTAMVLKETAQNKGHLKHFEVESTAAYMKAKKSISSSPNRELQQLFEYGFACHHAGMLRSDRYIHFCHSSTATLIYIFSNIIKRKYLSLCNE